LPLLRKHNALSFFPAFCAFPGVISAFAVAHRPESSPACRAIAMGANGTSNMANKTGKGGSRNIPELPRSDSDADSAPVPNCLSKSGNHLRSRTLALVERSSAMGA
jgi:hypothetical protein